MIDVRKGSDCSCNFCTIKACGQKFELFSRHASRNLVVTICERCAEKLINELKLLSIGGYFDCKM